ncbi:OmpL47-type beta-barrel domain-containing protein [Paenibacillus sp. GCM10027628]|uniref:OmpL47-type beta-barrel domain-containing protein n=1 Tax=Paenibacillus sp. GCM10027628 TaxID=3273413 RepID=UPI00363EEA60
MNGWYTHPVTVALSSTDNQSGVARTEYSFDNGSSWTIYNAPFTLDREGQVQILYRSVDQAGNVEEAKSLSFQTDAKAPVTTTVVTPAEPDGLNGWYTHPVTVALSATDNQSGVARTEYSFDNGSSWTIYNAPVILDREGKIQVLYRSVDQAGNVEEAKSLSFQTDLTPPQVQIHGAASYTIDQDIVISCTATDSVSGVTYSSCNTPLLQAKAYTLAPGVHTVTATAEDAAGHRQTVNFSFTVSATFESISTLTGSFVAETGVNGADGIANALQKKLDNAKAKALEGKGAVARNQLDAYINQVSAQSGKALTKEQAATLVRWATSLRDATPLTN